MKEDTKKRLYDHLSSIRNHSVSIVCIILALSVLVAPVVAQTINQVDDFEDQQTDGWEGENIAVDSEAIDGNYSMRTRDGVSSQFENPEWTGGPTLDLNEEFTLTGISRVNHGSGGLRSGFGLAKPTGDNNVEGVMLIFSDEYGSTFIANVSNEDPTASNVEQINNDYNNVWVNWELSSSGNGNITAKVWEYDTAEPSSPQITRQMEPETGTLTVFMGTIANNRETHLDSVTLEGTQVESDPYLNIDTGNYLSHGETQEYTIYNKTIREGKSNLSVDVTENATLTSLNETVLTVDEPNRQLISTSDTAVNDRVVIRSDYEGRVAYQEVTVASPTIDNLDVLPFMWRISAMFQDRGFQMILVGLLMAIAATRTAGVYAGLGVYQMTLTAGWLIGWVPIGLAMVGLFTTLFIGLNIAANIDYSVRR